MSVDFKDLEYINIPGYDFKLTKISNLKISNEDLELPTKIIKDKVYLLSFDKYFYHQVQEIACQYDFIKHFFPDIKIFFVDQYCITDTVINNDLFFNKVKDISFRDYDETSKNKNAHRYFEDLYKIYLNDSIDPNIYSLRSYNFIFKEVYLITDVVKIIPSYIFDKKGVMPVWTTSKFKDNAGFVYSSMNDLSIRLFKDRVKKYLFKDDHSPKKIYISRADANKRYELYLSTLDPTNSKEYLDFVKIRYFKDDYKIEEYFKEKGYTPLSLEGMSFLDQLQYFYNATHIAGTIGSGFLNIIAAPEKCKVFELHVLKNYYFGYKYISDVMKHNHYKIKLSLQDNIEGMINMLNYYRDEY